MGYMNATFNFSSNLCILYINFKNKNKNLKSETVFNKIYIYKYLYDYPPN